MDLWLLGLLFLLILIGIPLIFALAMAITGRRVAREEAEKRARLEAAEARAGFAVATLVSARTLAARTGAGFDLVRVTLRIEPPDGEPYNVVATWEVEPQSGHLLQPGQSLAVKINPDDLRQAFPNFTWARLSL